MKRVFTKETRHCDVCDKELPAEYSDKGHQWLITQLENYDHPHSGGSQATKESFELCNDCGKLMLRYVHAAVKVKPYVIEGLPFLIVKEQ